MDDELDEAIIQAEVFCITHDRAAFLKSRDALYRWAKANMSARQYLRWRIKATVRAMMRTLLELRRREPVRRSR